MAQRRSFGVSSQFKFQEPWYFVTRRSIQARIVNRCHEPPAKDSSEEAPSSRTRLLVNKNQFWPFIPSPP